MCLVEGAEEGEEKGYGLEEDIDRNRTDDLWGGSPVCDGRWRVVKQGSLAC